LFSASTRKFLGVPYGSAKLVLKTTWGFKIIIKKCICLKFCLPICFKQCVLVVGD
jgi:hypothetical protein